MKVMKEGNWNATWEAKVACETCQAELLIGEADLSSSWDYKTRGTKYFVRCPCCKKEVSVPGNTLTQRLKEKLAKSEPSSGDHW